VAPAVLWFRRDLRLDDLPALAEAVAAGRRTVVPLFVVNEPMLARTGPNRRHFLADALTALNRDLRGTLVLRRGDPGSVVPAVAAEVGARVVAATADFTPWGRRRDTEVATALAGAQRRLIAVDSPYAVAPGLTRGMVDQPLQVFSAFHRSWERHGWSRPVPTPGADFVGAESDVDIDAIESPVNHPDLPAWWQGLPLGRAATLPTAGAAAAHQRLEEFLHGPLATYAHDRDRPAVAGTSGLSPHLRFGCIHPRTILTRLTDGHDAERMRTELAWREFYADVLWHHPESVSRSLRGFGDRLRWDDDATAGERFQAWATGQTGYPLVDAGMRQLLAEGWMHNRVRMVTASFLVKDLHIDWRLGARWFMWHLVDGDIASNQHGWQWVAGTGTDAAPFHRVLNPMLQQERFDPDGVYVRRYCGDGPGPAPIVDHTLERREALARFDDARQVLDVPAGVA